MSGFEAEIGIIGAGMAGLTVARRAADAGKRVVVFEKGRGLGGRISTRRAEGMAFDHGAPAIEAPDPALDALFAGPLAGVVADWPGARTRRIVGVPGMSALVRPLAEGLDIRTGTEIGALRRRDGWALFDRKGGKLARVERLVLAIPAPQALMLAGSYHGVTRALSGVRMAPAWVAMLGFSTKVLPGLDEASPGGILARIHRVSAKPGREGLDAWVIEGGRDWSATHVEEAPDSVAPRLLEAMEDALGPLPHPVHIKAHRWRYAGCDAALGEAFLAREQDTLFIGGDWCLGESVAAAHESGRAIAAALGV